MSHNKSHSWSRNQNMILGSDSESRIFRAGVRVGTQEF